jgi:predicted ATPase
MIKLTEATVLKYKSIETPQTFSIEKDVTVLVGMNESGKTSILEALAKTHYFEDDDDFKFSLTHDYPRKEKKSVDKQGEDPSAITCKFEIDDRLLKVIEADLGKGVYNQKEFSRTTTYENKSTVVGFMTLDFKAFIKHKTKELGLTGDIEFDVLKAKDSQAQLNALIGAQTDGDIKGKLEKLKPYFENTNKWEDPLGEYTYRKHIKPHLPKFLYYDEFYALPSRISINKIKSGTIKGEEGKTGKALFELADINIDELLSASDFEDFKAELEATEAIISDELFKYWKTNRNLRIEFEIDKIVNDQRIVEHILDIRVRNDRARVSLPLRNRSKGFNWFFSFLVWFKKIQEDKNSSYVLLLDEPGLNLHASAQADLLEFIEDLSKDYQILYTTHSPFMIDATKLPRIRTVVETKDGSKVSDSIQEKDPNTLFPLQAALGYNIAQNLFISKNNLLVEGASDLLYLQVISSLLSSAGREGLKDDIITKCLRNGGVQCKL